MPIKVPRQVFQLQYEGVFDLHGMYLMVTDYFYRNHFEYWEGRWKEKESTPAGREVEIKMQPFRRVSEYAIHKYSVFWENTDVQTVNVPHADSKKELVYARIRFEVSGEITLDWQDFGGKHGWLDEMYRRHIIKRELDVEHWSRFRKEMQILMEKVKQFLGMEANRLDKGAYRV